MLGGVDPFESKRLLSESKTWKQGAIEKVKKLVLEDKSQTSVNVTLRKIYTRMRNVYGVVFDQELKEYMNKYHPNKKPSVLELIDQKEALRNLFDSIFSGIKSRDEDHVEHPVPKLPKDIIRESISPLIQKYNDNTVGGRATYKKVYGAMPVCWNNRQTRYMKANNTSVRPSKFRLVETDNKLLKLFIKTVEDKLKK